MMKNSQPSHTTPPANKAFPKFRTIKGVQSQYVNQWQNYPLEGLYLTKHVLDSKVTEGETPVILFPGVFDPLNGEYNAQTILSLLNIPNVNEVYEVHFQYENQIHKLNAQAVINDIKHISFEPYSRPIFIGFSSGASLLAAGLWQASQISPLFIRGCYLIAPYIPGQDTWIVKYWKFFFSRQWMQQRVYNYSGHKYVFENIAAAETWYHQSRFKIILENLQASPFEQFPVPVDIQYFFIDFMNKKGRKLLRTMFSTQERDSRFPGMHRALYKIPMVNSNILNFCKKCI